MDCFLIKKYLDLIFFEKTTTTITTTTATTLMGFDTIEISFLFNFNHYDRFFNLFMWRYINLRETDEFFVDEFLSLGSNDPQRRP